MRRRRRRTGRRRWSVLSVGRSPQTSCTMGALRVPLAKHSSDEPSPFTGRHLMLRDFGKVPDTFLIYQGFIYEDKRLRLITRYSRVLLDFQWAFHAFFWWVSQYQLISRAPRRPCRGTGRCSLRNKRRNNCPDCRYTEDILSY